MRTVQSGHTVICADQFDSDGWQLSETTESCQDNDEGFVTNYMSAISQMHQRTRCMDNDTQAGDYDSTSTLSCRPRPKTTLDVHGFTIFFHYNLCTSSFRFKSGKPTFCFSQNQ